MARKKGPKMIEELVTRRARGEGFQTIAVALKIARNTVKSRLRQVGGYEISEAKKLLLAGLPSPNKIVGPVWSHLISWEKTLNEIESSTPIKEYWEEHLLGSANVDLRNVPYETFWREFRRRYPRIDIHYHKHHDPGERVEVDYKGDSPGLGYIDKLTGEFIDCRLFGAVLCNSRLFFPYASVNEKQESWLGGIGAGFRYFGGVTRTLVVDNTRCAVNRADWYDPDLNQEFFNFCNYYDTAMVAARPRRPKDKNLIEVHLGVFWRWVRRRIKNHPFFSLGELNRFLKDSANEFNERYQRKYGSSRRQRFNAQEVLALKPLPASSYEYGFWKKAKLHEDCHIQHKYNFYSAPYQHRGKELDVRVSLNHVEIFYQQERIATHQRRPDSQRGNYCTDKKHLPKKFQAMEELSVSRQINEAQKVGPSTEQVITTLLKEASHPHMFLRRTMGILRLKRRYGADKLERACEVLLHHHSTKPRVKEVERMINSPNLEQRPKALPIDRKPNPHLHGQMSFATQGDNIYEPTPKPN